MSKSFSIYSTSYYSTKGEIYEYIRNGKLDVKTTEVKDERGRSRSRSRLEKSEKKVDELRQRTINRTDIYCPGFNLFFVQTLLGYDFELNANGNTIVKMKKSPVVDEFVTTKDKLKKYLDFVNTVSPKFYNDKIVFKFGYVFNLNGDKKYDNLLDKELRNKNIKATSDNYLEIAEVYLSNDLENEDLISYLTHIYHGLKTYVNTYLNLIISGNSIHTKQISKWETNPFNQAFGVLAAAYSILDLKIPENVISMVMTGYDANLISIVSSIQNSKMTSKIGEQYNNGKSVCKVILDSTLKSGRTADFFQYITSLNTLERVPISLQIRGFISTSNRNIPTFNRTKSYLHLITEANEEL